MWPGKGCVLLDAQGEKLQGLIGLSTVHIRANVEHWFLMIKK